MQATFSGINLTKTNIEIVTRISDYGAIFQLPSATLHSEKIPLP